MQISCTKTCALTRRKPQGGAAERELEVGGIMADELDPAVRRNEHGNYMVVTRPHFRGNGYLSCPAVPDPDPAWNRWLFLTGI
ncbi:MAG: hypothetical protein KGZ25_06435 [Planctomycetes bacterium]|nr:hypothetical protein [Planctomycetota bacterium]